MMLTYLKFHDDASDCFGTIKTKHLKYRTGGNIVQSKLIDETVRDRLEIKLSLYLIILLDIREVDIISPTSGQIYDNRPPAFPKTSPCHFLRTNDLR